MADQREIDEALEHDELPEGLSDEIAKRWDPDRLLKAVARRAGRGERLDAATRAKYERKLGVDLGKVRIYTGEFAQAVTQKHGAEAVTVGDTGMIMMGGRPDSSMATVAGEMLLAHELTHVAQTQRGLHSKALPFGENHGEFEEEAEQAEAAVHDETFGVTPEEESQPLDFDLVLARVLKYFDEDDRVYLERNGAYLFRP